MTSSCFRFSFLLMVALATIAVPLFTGAQDDPADLPSPITSKSTLVDTLDGLDVGPIKPLPYHEMADDPLTPTSPSTVSQFLTNADDVVPFDILERPGIPIGWFVGLELTAANARVSNRMQSEGLLGPTSISVPSAPMDWTAMPKVTLGYRLAEGLAELSASYRFISTQGDSSVSPFNGGTGNVSSNFQQHLLDLDYSFSDLFPNDLFLVPRQIRLTGGVRVAGMNYKTTASGGPAFGQSASNTFIGAGPHVALESLYPIGQSRWTAFGKVDTAGVIGADKQTFSQTTGGTSASGSTTSTIATPVLGLRAGVNWLPSWGADNVKMSAGYQWERWYMLGTDTSSYNELTIQGPFLRGEVAF